MNSLYSVFGLKVIDIRILFQLYVVGEHRGRTYRHVTDEGDYSEGAKKV